MHNLKKFEALATYSDTGIGNDIFKVNLLPLDDLSNNGGGGERAKPENDLLDKFGDGDIVTGEGISDGETHTGPIVNIKKDEEGENIEVSIEEDGEVIELKATTVKMSDDRGPLDAVPVAADFDPTADPDNYLPRELSEDGEQKPAFKNLKSFSDFDGE